MSSFLNPLDMLLQPPDVRLPPDFRWGYVDAVSPTIRVRLDRDPTAVVPDCSTLCPVAVGDRVLVLLYEGRATIMGAATS